MGPVCRQSFLKIEPLSPGSSRINVSPTSNTGFQVRNTLRYSLLVSLLLVLPLFLANPAWATPVSGARGMVASAHPAATDAGVLMLRQGGNAADAAAAAAFAVAVAEPYSSGIGGGGFALIRFGDDLLFMDFREVAPKKATVDMYLKDGKAVPELSTRGSLAVAVPGAVAGYLKLQSQYGKLKRADVLAPAIKIAEEGFTVGEHYRKNAERGLEALRKDEEASRIFLVKNIETGHYEVPSVGHRITQKDLGKTLRTIAEKGFDGFYQGEVGILLAKDIKERGGIISAEDLSSYKVRMRKPLLGSFRGHAIATSPPPSSGGQIVLTILNMLETVEPTTQWRSEEHLHLYIEASKRAFSDRILLGDPDFVKDVTPCLIKKDRAALLRQIITTKATAPDDIPPGQGAQLPPGTLPKASKDPHQSPSTTHLTVLDAEGNAVSMTSTINYGWGAAIVAKGTGVLWNDEMDDFAIAPGVPNVYGIVGSNANAIAPGKVPLSSMSPTLVFQNESTQSPLLLVLGSPGGPRIPTTVAQAIWHFVDHGADIKQAISIGRVHHQHLPNKVFVETFALEPASQKALEKRGHKIEKQRPWSNANGIAVNPKTHARTGATDPRGIGSAVAE